MGQGSGGRAGRHLLADVGGDLVELGDERVVVELVLRYVLQPIVFFAISAVSLISSSDAPNSRAASVWKYAQ
jgi:hypothetical protein